jgi:hypothetical protein
MATQTVQFTGSQAQALTKTVGVIVPPTTNLDGELCDVGVSFDGNPSVQNLGIKVDLIVTTVTTAGTAGSGVTIQPYRPGGVGSAATATGLYTAEPSLNVLRSWYVNPSGGLLVVQFPLGRGPKIIAASSPANKVGIRLITPATMTTVNYIVDLAWEE